MITFTAEAASTITGIVRDAGPECAGLRIRAQRLGQHTFRYQMHLVRPGELASDDFALAQAGFTVFLDPQTAEWMEGARIDFRTTAEGSGFQIDNPAAEPDWDDPVARRVQEVIDHQVLPAVAQHGGWLELRRVEGDTAYVVLGGGCQGCAGAQETLKQGVEMAITREVPEILHVVDETDHAAGSHPYATGCGPS